MMDVAPPARESLNETFAGIRPFVGEELPRFGDGWDAAREVERDAAKELGVVAACGGRHAGFLPARGEMAVDRVGYGFDCGGIVARRLRHPRACRRRHYNKAEEPPPT